MGNKDWRKFSSSLLNMDIRPTWLTIALALVTLATTASSSEPRVVCYYTNWSVYRPGTARFNPQNINPYLCTHLVYAFGGFTKENTLKPFDKYQDIEKGGYAKFTGLKTYNKNLKTLLAIGGWNEGSSRFSPMVASRERRKEFVRNAIKFLRQNRFDGLDLDWEYPAFRDGGKPKDRENYAKLVKELREEFEREAEKTGKPRLLLTMAVPAGIEYIQKGFDVKTLNQYLDWMNLLTYDYHSAFEPAVNHHAPLYPLEEPNEYSVDNELNIDYTIKFYLENGADRDKLVLGIPTYGRSYTLFNPDATEIGAPADGPGEQGDATREKGYLAYYEICESLKPKEKKRSTSDEDDSSEEEEDQPWTILQPNPDAMGPVAYRGNQWVGYDDMDIVRKKAEYVADMGLGGIMFWSIDNDDFRGACHGKPYPLIEAAKEAYINKIGSTDNAVVTSAPKAVTSSSSRRKSRPRTSSSTTIKAAAVKSRISSTTPAWSSTPEPPTTPDPGADFKCKDEGFFPHPRDCKKYFWCLDSGPSQLGIVAHQFTCPSGLFFNKAADSCDFARNVLCKKPSSTTEAPATKKETTTKPSTTTTTTRKPVKLVTKNTSLFRTTTTSTTTPEPELEDEEYEEEADVSDIEAEDPKVIKELIDLIKKVGGVEQLEKQLHLSETASESPSATTTPATFNKKLYQKVLQRTRLSGNTVGELGSSRGSQSAGLSTDTNEKYLRKDRPQYTSINRFRQQTSTTEQPQESEEEKDIEITPSRSRTNDARETNVVREIEGGSVREIVGTTAKPLQYVNIRRARPSTISTSDTADDTASRNALFERSEPVSVSESVIGLEVISARKETTPEYVTIRRQRPSTEEPTTVQFRYETEQSEQSLETVDKDIPSPQPQPQYTSIVRPRSTTQTPTEELNSPEPTTVLAVQISSINNSPTSEATEEPTQTEPEAPTTSTTTEASSTSSSTTRRVSPRRRSTTTPATLTSSTQSYSSNRRKNFIRRTRPTQAPSSTDPVKLDDHTLPPEPHTTSRYTRRGVSKFKNAPKKEFKAGKNSTGSSEKEKENVTTLSSAGARARNETKRVFVRRRNFGGANATSTTTTTTAAPPRSSPPRVVSAVSRPRPFRVANRRRPLSTTAAPTTLASEEALQDLDDTDSAEELEARIAPTTKTNKVQKRPLTTLKEVDQNPSATNEERKGHPAVSSKEEGKRQSKKFSSSFKQNQLNEVLKQKSKSQEVFDTTTEDSITTIEDFDPEAALALAAHQLISAPFPVPEHEEPKTTTTTKKTTTRKTTPKPTTRYSEPTLADTEPGIFTSTPTYTTIPPRAKPTTRYTTLKNDYRTSELPFTSTVRKPSGFTTKVAVLNNGHSITETFGPSTAKYLGNSEKYVSVPIEDFGFSTDAYVGGISQEPAYFTREYLLESPVTRTYDEEYQYLTTPQSTTPRRLPPRTFEKKISTTLRPTPPPAPRSPRTRPPPTPKPFEKVTKAPKVYRPIENYDYYDENDEKLAGNIEDGTKVILHGKGNIQCLDIGNFPHPTSCKKFISCARMEGGTILGWEYICPRGLSFDPVGGICNWSAGLGCDEN